MNNIFFLQPAGVALSCVSCWSFPQKKHKKKWNGERRTGVVGGGGRVESKSRNTEESMLHQLERNFISFLENFEWRLPHQRTQSLQVKFERETRRRGEREMSKIWGNNNQGRCSEKRFFASITTNVDSYPWLFASTFCQISFFPPSRPNPKSKHFKPTFIMPSKEATGKQWFFFFGSPRKSRSRLLILPAVYCDWFIYRFVSPTL